MSKVTNCVGCGGILVAGECRRCAKPIEEDPAELFRSMVNSACDEKRPLAQGIRVAVSQWVDQIGAAVDEYELASVRAARETIYGRMLGRTASPETQRAVDDAALRILELSQERGRIGEAVSRLPEVGKTPVVATVTIVPPVASTPHPMVCIAARTKPIAVVASVPGKDRLGWLRNRTHKSAVWVTAERATSMKHTDQIVTRVKAREFSMVVITEQGMEPWQITRIADICVRSDVPHVICGSASEGQLERALDAMESELREQNSTRDGAKVG